MAIIDPLSGGGPQTTGLRPQPAGPAADARIAAQRAFFQAALGKAAAAHAPASVETVQAQRPAMAPIRAEPPANAAAERPRRPGSLLDITV